MLSNLIHNFRVFLQRRKARKIVAKMELDQWQATSMKYYPTAQAFTTSCPSDLVLKIENKRRELGYPMPHEVKVSSVRRGNKTVWFHEHPNGEKEIVKEVVDESN